MGDYSSEILQACWPLHSYPVLERHLVAGIERYRCEQSLQTMDVRIREQTHGLLRVKHVQFTLLMEALVRLRQEDFCEFEANPGFAVSSSQSLSNKYNEYPKTTADPKQTAAKECGQLFPGDKCALYLQEALL